MTAGEAGGDRDLEQRFDAAMLDIYERAGREVGYWATRYLQMLRRRGGLETARYLLGSRTTSDGYARLRDAGRLDLTVEAHVLRREFEPLFTPQERARARERLKFFERVMEESARVDDPPDPALERLLTRATLASPEARVQLRDEVAAFGLAAIRAVEAWVAAGNSPGFACIVILQVGKAGHAQAAIRALRRLLVAHPDWASVINPAVAGLSHRP